MHIKSKYINAVHSAIDFIENRVDGADDGQQEDEMLDILRELRNVMQKNQHQRRVKYFLRKKFLTAHPSK